MADEIVVNIIETKCQPEDEEKFNKWYNEVHIPMLLKSRGLKGVARYQVKDDSSRAPRYLAVYRFPSQKDFEAFEQSPETAAAIKEMQETWGNKVQLVSRTKCELIREW